MGRSDVRVTQANHYVLNGGGVTGTLDTVGFTGRPVVALEIDGEAVEGAEVRTSELGVEVHAVVADVADLPTRELMVVLPTVGVTDEPVPFAGLALLTTSRTSIGGPGLVRGVRQAYEVRPLAGTAEAVEA